MKTSPVNAVEPVGTYPFPLGGWTCFHCGETFSIAAQGSRAAATAAATEHFGPDPRWRPGCLELVALRPSKLYRRLRRAEMKLAAMPDLEEQVEFLHDVARDRDALRNRVDSLEGELEVERLRFREAR